MKTCLQPTAVHGSDDDSYGLQSMLIDSLMSGPLEPADYIYFGEQAFPLVKEWLNSQAQLLKEAVGEDNSNASKHGLSSFHRSYWAMLGMNDAPAFWSTS